MLETGRFSWPTCYVLGSDFRVVERRDLFREFLRLVYDLLRPTIAVG